MESSATSTATSIPVVEMVSKSGIQLEHSLAEFWSPVESRISASARKAKCSSALSKGCGGCRWLARQRALYLAFELRNMIHIHILVAFATDFLFRKHSLVLTDLGRGACVTFTTNRP